MPTLSSDQRALLEGALARSEAAGLIGGPSLDHHLSHALGFVEQIERVCGPAPGACLDLGSGGGLPGVVIALALPGWRVILLDASARRCRVLEEVAADLAERVPGLSLAVVHARAEDAARAALRGTCDVVTARSFGPPAVTAECAVGFLRPGGHLIVSEPPRDADLGHDAVDDDPVPPRWPAAGLEALGFGASVELARGDAGPGHYAVLSKTRDDEQWPRRNGLPARRPLW